MQNFHLSLHCWQADDVTGFEVQAGSLTGGIGLQVTIVKARNIDERRRSRKQLHIPSAHRLNLHGGTFSDFKKSRES